MENCWTRWRSRTKICVSLTYSYLWKRSMHASSQPSMLQCQRKQTETERLVLSHIEANILTSLQSHHRIPSLHTALTHQEERVTYVRMLFVDSSSAFNTAHPQTAPVGSQLTSICNWILSFLSKHHHGLAPVSLQSMMNQSTEWRCKMW